MDAFESARNSLSEAYANANPKSASIYNAATSSLPGGNTRSVLYYSPFPLSISHASGARLFAADGTEYLDFLGEYTAGLYGHSHPLIKKSIIETVDRGINFGSHHEDEGRLAALIKERFEHGSIELLRFTNSGTEANLMAVTAARALYAGKRAKVLVFEGAYHGGVFTFAKGNSPVNAPFEFLLAKYNDVQSVDEVVKKEADGGKNLAAIIVEPMLGAGGAVMGKREFLEHLRKVADEAGAVLIFDEVMTSRMFSGGGVQTEYGIVPDLTTLGKYIGGGMSIGAFGGRRDIMGQFDPRTGSLPHAGTFNNNVFSMAAGRVGMEKIFTREVARELHERGERFRKRVNDATKGTILKATGLGSIMSFHFTSVDEQDIRSQDDFGWRDAVLFDVLHLELLQRGIYIARRGFVTLSLEVSEADMEVFVAAVKGFVEKYGEAMTAIGRG